MDQPKRHNYNISNRHTTAAATTASATTTETTTTAIIAATKATTTSATETIKQQRFDTRITDMDKFYLT